MAPAGAPGSQLIPDLCKYHFATLRCRPPEYDRPTVATELDFRFIFGIFRGGSSVLDPAKTPSNISMPASPIEIGRRAALAGALDALQSFRALTELVRDSAYEEGAAENACSATDEIAAADSVIQELRNLLGEVPGGIEQPDLFALMGR